MLRQPAVEIQEELVIEAPRIEVPEDLKHKADQFIENYTKKLERMTEGYSQRSLVEIEAGGPLLVGGYQYWNCLTVGPVQFLGNPPYLPNRIVAAGEVALMLGVIWINPVNGPGGSLPGTIVLGARPFRARFETVNLTTVTNGPDFTATGTFASPAPIATVIPWFLVPADPGNDPHLLEINFTADITTGGQPFAAFSTWHLDLDSEPPFMGLPPISPNLLQRIPTRVLVYRQ
jgi:hypothetical protein